MLIECHSDSSNAQLIAKELRHHYENCTYSQTHVQDIQANLTNLCIATWKGTFHVFLNHWELQWLLTDKGTPISNQESPAVHKSMLCNAIHSNPSFLSIKISLVRPKELLKLLIIHGFSYVFPHFRMVAR